MIVFSDVVDRSPSPTRNPGLDLAVDIAKLLELPVYPLVMSPSGVEVEATVLSQVPSQMAETAGVWIGEPPTASQYEAVYQQALHKGIRLLNTPEDYRTIQNFEQIQSRLQGLTPPSQVITEVGQCETAIAHLGLPISVRAESAFNPLSPRATTLEELQHLTTQLLQQPRRLNSHVILQSAVPLHSHPSPIGMAFGRVFRIFLYDQTLITYGYAWAGDHPGRYLSTPEEEDLLALVFRAIAQISVPFVSLDVGQLESGEWLVLGTSDPQFAGTTQIPWIQFWRQMREVSSP